MTKWESSYDGMIEARESSSMPSYYECSEADEVIAEIRDSLALRTSQAEVQQKLIEIKDEKVAARDKTIEGLKGMVHECFLQSCPDYTAHLGQLYSVEELDRLWRQSDMKATLDSILGLSAEPPATAIHSEIANFPHPNSVPDIYFGASEGEKG